MIYSYGKLTNLKEKYWGKLLIPGMNYNGEYFKHCNSSFGISFILFSLFLFLEYIFIVLHRLWLYNAGFSMILNGKICSI